MVLHYRYLLFALLFPLIAIAQSTPDPKHEFRSVWLTTAGGQDWPKSTDSSIQQNSLSDIIRQAKAIDVYVRTSDDVRLTQTMTLVK